MNELGWTEEQTNLIDDAIATEIENTRLADKIIPEIDIPEDARTVSQDRYDYQNNLVIEEPLDVPTPDRPFVLTKSQVEDSDLSRATVAIRRAAQQLSALHDRAVFHEAIRNSIDQNAGKPGYHRVVPIDPPDGDGIIAATALAVSQLDQEGYRGGFVMVAGQNVYQNLYTRPRHTASADLPVKSVEGLLEGGPIHRVGPAVLPADEALILVVGSGHIDRAVAMPTKWEFLRIANDNNREFRIYERFVTRFKETYCATLLRFAVPAAKP